MKNDVRTMRFDIDMMTQTDKTKQNKKQNKQRTRLRHKLAKKQNAKDATNNFSGSIICGDEYMKK